MTSWTTLGCATPAVALVLAACMSADEQPARADAAAGELAARPAAVAAAAVRTGAERLDARGERSSLLYVPANAAADRPAPLLVMLHGAGGTGDHAIALVRRHADAHGIIVLAPTAQAASWDVIAARRYGPDVRALDAALTQVFARYPVDPTRVAVGGFSDGASYALSLGVINGGLFRSIIAFSPGFLAPTKQAGSPRIFISHGIKDQVLPIDPCSRTIVPRLKQAGYDVAYIEFPDGHSVPERIADQAFDWFLSAPR